MGRRRILVVVADATTSNARAVLARRFADDELEIRESLTADASNYDLAVLWNYPRRVGGVEGFDNLVVCHSSALPQDRGMAPIYHTIACERPFVTTSVLRVASALDAGPILAQAAFPNRPEYTAPVLRRWLEALDTDLLDALSLDGRVRRMRGRPQVGEGNINPRRRPADNQVAPEVPLQELMPHLRACEPAHPAFIEYEGVRYLITVAPEREPEFPAPVFAYYD